MARTLLTRVKSHVIDIVGDYERMSLGGFALQAPEFHQIHYVPVKGSCCNLWEPDVRQKGVRVQHITANSYLVEESSGHRVSQQAASGPELVVGWLDDVVIPHCIPSD